jgi:hypothetical protein
VIEAECPLHSTSGNSDRFRRLVVCGTSIRAGIHAWVHRGCQEAEMLGVKLTNAQTARVNPPRCLEIPSGKSTGAAPAVSRATRRERLPAIAQQLAPETKTGHHDWPKVGFWEAGSSTPNKRARFWRPTFPQASHGGQPLPRKSRPLCRSTKLRKMTLPTLTVVSPGPNGYCRLPRPPVAEQPRTLSLLGCRCSSVCNFGAERRSLRPVLFRNPTAWLF